MKSGLPQLLLMACALVFASTRAEAALHYSLSFDAVKESMHVELCGASKTERREFLVDRGAEEFASELKRSSGKPLEAGRGRWIAAGWEADECLRYEAALGRIADRNREDVGWRIAASGKDSDLVISAQQWLMETEHEGRAEVSVDLPQGYSISTPWSRDAKNPRQYRIAPTPRDWATNIAIGRFAMRDVPAGTGVVHLALAGVRESAMQEKLVIWIGGVVRAALSAYGRLPRDEVQVLVLPVGKQAAAVVFGMSTRGQGHGLILLVDPAHPLSEFTDDWTAVHEFSHLFHPYLGDEGRWVAEGLATYWQNVLRARSGLLTAPQAWSRLEAGFVRGRDASHSGLPLGGGEGQHRERGFTRVYWAGAAFWMSVDTRLRSGGALSVNLALERFRDCCLAEPREWPPAEFMAKLDALLGTKVFVPSFTKTAAETGFPDLSETYATLGISKAADGSLQFNDAAPGAVARQVIMSAPRP
jgi:hypothetical protein